MCARFFRKTYIAKILMVLLLLVPLTACGIQNRPSASSTTTPSPSKSSSSSSNQSDNLSLNKTGISIDKANLHIDASSGVQCPMSYTFMGPSSNPGLPFGSGNVAANDLVLATNRVTYDSNELKQIQDYIRGNSVQIPNTLRWVLGGSIDTSRKVTVSGKFGGYQYDCGIEFYLTNTGQNLIQIANVSAKLTGNTQQNNFQYRLIDMCTLPNLDCGGGWRCISMR